MATLVERLAAKHEELENACHQTGLAEEELERICEELLDCSAEIASAPIQEPSDLGIKAEMLAARLLENLSPSHSAEVIDHMLAASIATGLRTASTA